MIGVFGLGNVLQRDDGFGPSAVRRLEATWDLGPDVIVKDLGTPGLDLPSYLLDLDAVIFLDTVKLAQPPGTPCLLRKADVLRADVQGLRGGTHETGVREGLVTADLVGRGAEDVCLVGVVPGDLESGTGLTPEVSAALDAACETALDELRRLGVQPVKRAVAAPAGTWWED